MKSFVNTIDVRWSDLDPNYHVRHSAYYDYGAQQRIDVLEQLGLTLKLMQQEGFGPVLFREECMFRREIKMGDKITIELNIVSMREDGSRWTMAHTLKNQAGDLCAVITVDGAWMDLKRRKLCDPTPAIIREAMVQIPKSEAE